MSDMPRFTIIDGQEYPDPDGHWVFVNDANAAVATARAEVGEDRVLGDVMAEHYRNKMSGPTQLSVSDEEEVYSLMQSYDRGFADGVKAAREAVIEVSQHDHPDIDPLEFSTPFDYAKAVCEAAIDKVEKP